MLSGQMSYQLKGDEIITQALGEINAFAVGQRPLEWQMTHARERFNAFAQSVLAMGLNLWTLVRSRILLEAGRNSYLLEHPVREIRATESRIVTGSGADLVAYPLVNMTRREFYLLPQQQTAGRPVQIYQDRSRPVSSDGDDTQGNVTIYLYPTPDAVTSYTLEYAAVRRYNDVVAPLDDMDFPSAWTLFLVYGLAKHLIGRYAQSATNAQRIEAGYREQLAIVRGDDKERGDMCIMPAYVPGSYY